MNERQHLRLLLAARKSTKVSDRDGHEQQSISIDKQDKRGRDWAERNGHTIVAVAADVKSGTVAPWDRKNLKPWVTDPVKMAQYDGILAFDNSRLSRGCWADEARIRLWAEEHGKVLVIVDGAQWPPRHDGDQWQWEAMAKQARATWEANRTASMDAQAELREQGKLVGRPVFGYVSGGVYKDHGLVPTEEGRIWVPRIFAWAIEGLSLNAIAIRLDEAGVKPTSGKKWWARSIGLMLRNPTFVGQRVDGHGRTIHTCEPLLVTEDGKPDFATFRAAGKALDGRPKRGHVDTENRAMLAGVIFCPRCEDSPMYRIKTAQGFFYRCTGRGSQRKGCGNMPRLELVDEAVNAILAKAFAGSPIMVQKLVPGHDHSAEIEAVRFEIRQLAALDLDDDEYDRRLSDLRAERDRLNALPAVPDSISYEETGETYASFYGGLKPSERGSWLAEKHFRITAGKNEVTVNLLLGGKYGVHISKPI
jgi:site-specific DNA recombinase